MPTHSINNAPRNPEWIADPQIIPPNAPLRNPQIIRPNAPPRNPQLIPRFVADLYPQLIPHNERIRNICIAAVLALNLIVAITAITTAKPIGAVIIISSAFILSIVAFGMGTEEQKQLDYEKIRKVTRKITKTANKIVALMREVIDEMRLERAMRRPQQLI